MLNLPNYVGPTAMGLDIGVIVPEMDIVDEVFDTIELFYEDGLLDDGDVICITESVVARAQNNYVSLKKVSNEIQEKLGVEKTGTIGVVFPIASRNRFSMILEAIAKAVSEGKVIVQMSFPCDNWGNQIISPEFVEDLGKDVITLKDIEEVLDEEKFKHPVTEVNYIKLYRDIIKENGAEPDIVLSHDPLEILDFDPDGVIAADIHTRKETKQTIREKFENCITLSEVCNEGEVRSTWGGLLGSNISSGDKMKLAPKNGYGVVRELQERVKKELGVEVEVIIYGDGAYKDPTSGIYELHDPSPTVAATEGLDYLRRGVKYKYLADRYYHEENMDIEEIEEILEEKKKSENKSENEMEMEGTTPRHMEDLLASLADLVSGSADAGTPVVLVKNFLLGFEPTK